MDRKALLTIILTAGLMFGWHFGYYAPRAEKQRLLYEAIKKQQAEEAKAKQSAVADVPKTTEPGAANATTPAGATTPPAAPAATPSVPEERKTLASVPGTVDYEFTSQGGGIIRGTLREHFKDKTNGTQVIINEFGTIPIGAMTEDPDNDALLKLPWKMSVNDTDHTVSFERLDDARHIKITKTFFLPREKTLSAEYSIGLDVTFENVGEQAMMAPTLFVHAGSAAPVNASETRQYQGFDWWRDGTNNFQNVDWFSAGGMLAWSHPERPVFRQNGDQIRWAAVTNQYFTTMVTILGYDGSNSEDLVKNLGTGVWAKRSEVTPDTWRNAGHSLDAAKQALHKVDGALAMPGFALEKGGKATKHLRIYSGPREYRRLRLLDNKEKDVLDYGSFLGIPTGPFSRLLLNSMNGLYAMTGSYALAIVLLTICVKALLWPLQNKANNNMKKMSALQPEMKRLQDKYKEEPVKFQQEMGKVWKKAGVNPLSGCWPMFIQIPIFIGFYNMLGKAVELRHHGFWWVKDLSQPDTVFHLAGIPINPLPLCMAVTMLAQMKLSPQGGDPAQRKMMMFMPLIFIFMCYNFASALALYWTIQNLISIVQLQITKRQNKVTLVPTSA
ncbi:MAG: YidC/Oxa1 family insertase periplasmic-domain containing protein [Chthoniobacteraceae bacterium]